MKLIDIHSPQDIKPLTIDDLKDLAKQMRAAIINYTSTIGGHVGPNLGDVEALIGVHLSLTPRKIRSSLTSPTKTSYIKC